jgi:hypothetical protein
VFTAATMVVFLVVFEFSRRTYAVATVFDRRRATKPNRTPPPLIRARYFEWLFLNTDPAYLEYSDMAHTREVIQERKRQQQSQTGKGPSFLDRISLFSTRGTNDRHDEVRQLHFVSSICMFMMLHRRVSDFLFSHDLIT